jgi:hypothetical protein
MLRNGSSAQWTFGDSITLQIFIHTNGNINWSCGWMGFNFFVFIVKYIWIGINMWNRVSRDNGTRAGIGNIVFDGFSSYRENIVDPGRIVCCYDNSTGLGPVNNFLSDY